MNRGTSQECELEDAELQIGDARFWNCGVNVLLEWVPFSSSEVSGTFSFTHPAPESLFFGEKGLPEKLDAVATVENETENVTLEIEGLLVCTEPDGNEVEFVAYNADMTVESKEEEPTAEERTVRLLDDLACDIVDGDANVQSVSVSRDPKKVHGRFFERTKMAMGPTTLEVVYDDE